MSRLQKLTIVIVRLGIGWYFLYAGIVAINDPSWNLLPYITDANTFPNFYKAIANTSLLSFTSYIFKGLSIIVGFLLISGLFVRFAALVGMLMTLFFYFPVLEFPRAGGPYYIVNEHIVLLLVLLMLFALRAGEYFGLATHFKLSRY